MTPAQVHAERNKQTQSIVKLMEIEKRNAMELRAKSYICLNCNTVGIPNANLRGSGFLELALWFFFFVPGFLYSVWRCGPKEKTS